MSGMTVTAAIVAALVAVTIWVFAGGSGGHGQATTEPPAPGNPTCQTAGNCVQAAQGLVQQLNQQAAQQDSQGTP